MAISKEFVLAGRAVFTVQEKGGAHHTFRVQMSEPEGRWARAWWADFLADENRYRKLAKLDPVTGQASTYGRTAGLAGSRKLLVLNRVLARVWSGDLAAVEAAGWRVEHAGRCGRCGRELTTPLSLDRGIGPECWSVMHPDAEPFRSVEHSDLGLKPGDWPQQLDYEGVAWFRGPYKQDGEGDLEHYLYCSQDYQVLCILND